MPKILKKSALFLFLVLSFCFLVSQVNPLWGQAPQAPGDEVTIPAPGYGITTPDELTKTIGDLIKVAFGIAAFLCFVYLLWGGVQWITSGGDKAKYEEARNRITAAIIGLAIVAAAWAVMLIATKLLKLEQLTPEGKITIPGLTW